MVEGERKKKRRKEEQKTDNTDFGENPSFKEKMRWCQ